MISSKDQFNPERRAQTAEPLQNAPNVESGLSSQNSEIDSSAFERSDDFFEDIKQFLGFTSSDAAHLAHLGLLLKPTLRKISDVFYANLIRHPKAVAVFAGDMIQIQRLRKTLLTWLEELFCGCYDNAYFERHSNIGRAHVRVNLPQHYMFTAMNVLRISLIQETSQLKLPDSLEHIMSLEKILDMELAIMSQTYHENMIARIQTIEQTRFQQELSESEHLATVGGLAASLAHEIKNPLAGISGAIQIIDAGLDNDHPHKEVIEEILRQIDRLDNAVRDLLIFARPKPPSRKETNLNELLLRVLTVLQEEPAFRAIDIKREMPEQPLLITSDETQLQQVLINLILNAVHASRENGTVTCRIKPSNHGARIEIEDNGTGIAPENLSRVWEPFFTTKAKGTGLGLSICKRIVEGHEGSIQISSKTGIGTLVAIVLPSFSRTSRPGNIT